MKQFSDEAGLLDAKSARIAVLLSSIIVCGRGSAVSRRFGFRCKHLLSRMQLAHNAQYAPHSRRPYAHTHERQLRTQTRAELPT